MFTKALPKMANSELENRLIYLTEFLTATSLSWSRLQAEIDLEIAELTNKLVSQNDEQLRGGIKALQKLKGLRDTLEDERKHISAALSDEDAA